MDHGLRWQIVNSHVVKILQYGNFYLPCQQPRLGFIGRDQLASYEAKGVITYHNICLYHRTFSLFSRIFFTLTILDIVAYHSPRGSKVQEWYEDK